MSSEPQLFRVIQGSRESERVEEADFAQLGLQERRDIQEWVAANPGILGDDLLIIGKEVSDFDRTNERLDLLAVDYDGKLVVIELKRDDTGADAHWQAIKYASYLHRASADDIIRMMADYAEISQEEAATRLLQHLGADDLNALNNDQRIILASHRFAPEVTSAALWLNEKSHGENLIACVKLTPYQDKNTGSLYIQASTIIPVPGIDEYVVAIGRDSQHTAVARSSNFAEKLQRAYDRNRNDEVTHFLRKVGELVKDRLPDEIRPNKVSRWAGGDTEWRYYKLWYAHTPWSNRGTYYRINLGPESEDGTRRAEVRLEHDQSGLESALSGVSLHPDQQLDRNRIDVNMGRDTLNEDFAHRIADMTRKFIEQITPIVDDLENESDEAEA